MRAEQDIQDELLCNARKVCTDRNCSIRVVFESEIKKLNKLLSPSKLTVFRGMLLPLSAVASDGVAELHPFRLDVCADGVVLCRRSGDLHWPAGQQLLHTLCSGRKPHIHIL